MHFQRVFCKEQPKGGTFGDAWDRVLALRESQPALFGECVFYLEEKAKGKISSCDRAQKLWGCLAEARGQTECLTGQTVDYVTNIESRLGDAAIPEGVDWYTVGTEFARGVPRRYPTENAMVMAQWRADGLPSPLLEESTSPVVTQNASALQGLEVARRWNDTYLMAIVFLGEVDSSGVGLPEVSPEIQQAIDSLGKTWWTEMIAVPTPAERERIEQCAARAEAEGKAIQQLIHDTSRRFVDECSLPPHDEVRSHACRDLEAGVTEGHVKNWRTTPKRVFASRGFRFDKLRTFPRIHMFTRPSDSGNYLALEVDVAGMGKPWMPMLTLHVCGLGWHVQCHLFPQLWSILTEEQWEELVQMGAGMFDEIAGPLVGFLDGVFGPSPTWLIEAPKLRSLWMGYWSAMPQKGVGSPGDRV